MSDPKYDFNNYEDTLLFVHENNILTKYKSNYNKKGGKIYDFYEGKYLKMREKLLELSFDEAHLEDFKKATRIINKYYDACAEFSKLNGITSQSKFVSTFLEEISSYLFKDIPEIKSGEFGIFNKNIYAGLKIDSNKHVGVLTKDVDFCLGKKVEIEIKDQHATSSNIQLIIPIVAVEVKTYLDATMFGEVKSSSGAIKSATPSSKTYLLMGYTNLKDEHIIAARQDSTLNEMFVLRAGAEDPIDEGALYSYWQEIKETIKNVSVEKKIKVPGRLLNVEDV